jgi:chemotaxis protein CheZ
MATEETVKQIRKALSDLKASNLNDPRLNEVMTLAENLVEAMKTFFSSLDTSVYGEFRYIADYIRRTRDEISQLRPNDISGQRIPSAGQELDAVVCDTQAATEAIMSEAEALMEAASTDPEFKARVDDAMMRMIEACSFQDLTGQRVRKVVATLQHIEERLSHFSHVMGVDDAEAQISEKEKWQKANLLNGPAIGGPEVAQDTIDALFDGESETISEEDLDALFN